MTTMIASSLVVVAVVVVVSSEAGAVWECWCGKLFFAHGLIAIG
jgi:hypothetical protein